MGERNEKGEDRDKGEEWEKESGRIGPHMNQDFQSSVDRARRWREGASYGAVPATCGAP